jgi:glutamyl-tRNA reductase
VRRAAKAADAEEIAIESLPALAQGACLILAYKGSAAPNVRESIEEGAGKAALVIDLTMPPFDWSAGRPERFADLELLAQESTLSVPQQELQLRLAGAARDAVLRRWERRYGNGAAPRLYRRVEEVRLREVARAAKRPNADPEVLDVVTKALVKRLFHRYANALRNEQNVELITATEQLFRFEAGVGEKRK